MSGPPSLLGAIAAALRRWRPTRVDAAGAAVALAFVPLAAALAMTVAALVDEVRADRLAAAAAPQLAAIRANAARAVLREDLDMAFGAPTLTDLAARLATLLPADAHVVALEQDDELRLTAEIETADPKAVAEALAKDRWLGRMRQTGQSPAAGEGVRARFASDS